MYNTTAAITHTSAAGEDFNPGGVMGRQDGISNLSGYSSTDAGKLYDIVCSAPGVLLRILYHLSTDTCTDAAEREKLDPTLSQSSN